MRGRELELDDLATASCAKAANIVTSNNMVVVVFMFPPIEMYSNGAATLRNVKRGFDLRLLRVATASFRPALDALDRQPDPQGNRNISRVAAGCRLVEFGRDVPPRCLVAEVRGQVLPDQKRTSASVASVMTPGMISGRAGARDQSAAVLLTRAMLAVGHPRDRGYRRRLINAAARIASLARHARAALARVRALARAAPRAIGMLLADPAGVVAIQARHDGKICCRVGESSRFPMPRFDSAVAVDSFSGPAARWVAGDR
jgi:hypothetical protein